MKIVEVATTKKQNNPFLDPEFGVDSTYKTTQEREEDSSLLMEARLNRLKNLSSEKITEARLLQLKLMMENYLNDSTSEKRNQFSVFVDSYINILYNKQKSFAKDLNITSNLLSKIINKHRKPNDEFILK